MNLCALLLSHASGYHFHNPGLIVGVMLLIGVIPFVGYAIVGIRSLRMARMLAWLLTIASVASVERLLIDEPAGLRMVLIIVALLWAMKAVVGVESLNRKPSLPLGNWLAFVLLWFGMRPKLFMKFSNQPRTDWGTYVLRGVNRIGLGVALIAIAIFLVFEWIGKDSSVVPFWRLWVATAFLMPGLSLLMHFGLFNLLVGFWRRFSINCTPLFRAPLLSTSLTEFWGKRWNLAFSEMTAVSVFRPIKARLRNSEIGVHVATASAFLFSGLLHELAISVPVQAGFGLPLLYFLLHGIGMVAENMFDRFGIEILNRPWIGSLWTWAWVMIPIPILFHRPFLEGCVWPLIGIGVR
ncbi:wax synthase family protein [Mariniblastus fucicola]|uniref:Wax synthase domain-containing protein n=1 Tax=Mariniblastus fucicola TaxID=980251 RepID=A0A5B9PMJ3_9BACT|nr:membrane bound O-acyl transferase family-domain-containing protein [Mariniblastus fucicola]QEG23533.1 hypothetical protein MFFC18_34340 [Mariniblastus fucicola]